MEPFSIGVVPVLLKLNARLLERLNSEPNQGALWRVETGQLACSKQGALRVIWKIIGGPIELGPYAPQGDAAPAPVLARRVPTIEAEIRAIDPRTSGLTAEDQNMAEKVMGQVLFVLNERLSGDVVNTGIMELWDEYTASPGQGQIILKVRFAIRALVHDNPHSLRPYTETTAEGTLTGAQT